LVGKYLSMLTFRIALLSALMWAWYPISLAAAGPQTLRYAISSNGNVAGSEVDTYLPDGRIESTFEFNDRGRGPKISAVYTLDSKGMPLKVDITGNDYLKAPADEHFEVKEGSAHWKSTAENGKAPTGGFYVSNNGPAMELAFLVAALEKSNRAPLHLPPAGEARLERLADVTLEDHGQKIHVTEFGITGLSYEPQTVWLDDEQHFFAIPGNGLPS
jgi:hypothetical protein